MTGPASLADLFGALAGAPSLPGARCRGRPHLFDPPHPEEAAATTAARHAQALALCQRCPSLDRCGQWLDSLRPRDRPTCVIAARIIETKQPKGNTA